MTAATVQAGWFGGASTEPAEVSAETGVTLNRSDTQTGTTPIPIPTTTGSNYSWVQQLALQVTAAASPATTLSNATIKLSATLATGLLLFFKGNATYLNQTGGTQAPADVGTENSGAPTTPAGYTVVTTTAQQWDAMGTTSNGGSTGRKSNFVDHVLGVCSTYAGSPGSTSLGNSVLSYDEARRVDNMDRDAVTWGRDPISASPRRGGSCRRRGRGDSW
jgi:hypothetical protein